MSLGESDLKELLEADEPEGSTTTGWVVFLVTHVQLNPDEITASLGISPDRVDYPEPADRRPGIWQLNSRLPGQAPIPEHFFDILHRLVPVHRQLWAFSERFSLEFFCSVQKTGATTAPLILPARLLLLLGYIGAEVQLEVADT